MNSYEVARKAGVSRAVVSYVWNGKADQHAIPRSTQERVHMAIRQTGYTPNYFIRDLCLKQRDLPTAVQQVQATALPSDPAAALAQIAALLSSGNAVLLTPPAPATMPGADLQPDRRSQPVASNPVPTPTTTTPAPDRRASIPEPAPTPIPVSTPAPTPVLSRTPAREPEPAPAIAPVPEPAPEAAIEPIQPAAGQGSRDEGASGGQNAVVREQRAEVGSQDSAQPQSVSQPSVAVAAEPVHTSVPESAASSESPFEVSEPPPEPISEPAVTVEAPPPPDPIPAAPTVPEPAPPLAAAPDPIPPEPQPPAVSQPPPEPAARADQAPAESDPVLPLTGIPEVPPEDARKGEAPEILSQPEPPQNPTP